jgi:ketosteroid isomerase-like protein
MDHKYQIEETVRRWWSAWAAKDIQALDDIAHQDYLEFTGGTVRSHGKQALLETARRVMPVMDLLQWDLQDLLVLLYGQTAVCNYYYSEAGRYKGNAYQSAGCATDVFVYEAGSWRLVAHHASEIRSPAGA